MRKTITITDQTQVEVGDKAYFKDCDFGFTVLKVNRIDANYPIKVRDPLIGEPLDRKSTRLNSSHSAKSRMPSSA